ncbi:DNA replication and repair protein RecF [Candidatus Gracilibacteria bacterium]|nr:DNA replication and repair protein RecF [Candidatus Gracilibacteria bacterium]
MINKLSLLDFRNYEHKQLEFKEKNIVFWGGNGRGKTNILEAISILSMGRSWRETSPLDLIRKESPSAKIEATMNEGDYYEIIVESNTRIFKRNEKKISLKQHFGRIPTLLFVPEHLTLFSGPKRDRQRFFDRFLFQISASYRDNLTRFRQALKQKNALLKMSEGSSSTLELSPWNNILAETIPAILNTRKEFLRELNPLLQKEFNSISGNQEPLSIELDIKEDYLVTSEGVQDFFTKNTKREERAQCCLIGPHRDDFKFYLRNTSLLSTASRGEERSVLLAMLAAKKHLLKTKLNQNHILLLDDVFSELDQSRQNHLEKLCNDSQIFFTTTHSSHFEKFSHLVEKFEI